MMALVLSFMLDTHRAHTYSYINIYVSIYIFIYTGCTAQFFWFV